MGTIREERETRDLTLEELSALTGLSKSTLDRAERGDSVSWTTARRIARTFGLKSSDLAGLNFSRRRRGAAANVHTEAGT